ncbi:methyl-accepting chemotaxis protein [Blastopirellula marina]|uniref:Histidine kinase n=1 Tax=Blastopirellula marina TaxID=124 RepID=A0A2S8F804_9BACT|nr:methyl-accepting chemotaxis protein [Blastopirellula marina]PQO28250.1 histidine kinase [Blastopirellula marina]PTL41790.1 PAS domain S-box protein [Blastopirellula marina]
MFGLAPTSLLSFFSRPQHETPSDDDLQNAALLSAIDRSALLIELDLAGQILTANDNFLQTFGYTLAELQGQHHRKLVAPEYATSSEYQQLWQDLKAGKYRSGEFQRVAQDGSAVLLQASYNPVFDEQGQPVKVLKIATDISQQLIEREEETRLRNMIENLPLNIMFADRDLIIRYVNPTSLRTFQKIKHLLPVAVDQIVGSSIGLFHQDPSHQARLLSNPQNLPLKTQFQLGQETIELNVSAIYDQAGKYIGPMASWQITTEQAQIRGQIGSLAEVGHTVAENVGEMAAAIEEIGARISRNAELAQETDEEVVSAGTSIRQLSDCSQEIDGIVLAIRELAEQTNLLALNATIEAARAGEAGRSFAVVASEVKSLATSTSGATKDIADRVARIRQNINSVVTANDHITSSVAEVNLNTNTVASAIEEQGAIIHGMKATADHLVQLAEELKKL